MNLDELAARRSIPDAGCRGLCAHACGPVPMRASEHAVLEAAAGRALPVTGFAGGLVLLLPAEDGMCPLLKDGRCEAYQARPTLCVLYGVAEGLPCPHGCGPADGRMIPAPEARRLLLGDDDG